MAEKFKVIPASYLFLIQEGNILLLQRANTGYEDGNWSVPAGHIDGGEPASAAAIREGLEETGLIISPKNIQFAHIIHRSCEDVPGIRHERVDFFFAVHGWEGEPMNMEPDKCTKLEWYPLNDLPVNVIECVRSALGNYQKNIPYSELGW